MNCQHVRQLLAFVDRKCEELDPAERDAVKQHLENCPECAAVAQAERGFDAAVGAALRNVEVPTGLKADLLKRLAAGRGLGRWKWAGGMAVAATVLVAVAGGIAWQQRQPVEISQYEVDRFRMVLDHKRNWTLESVQEFLRNEGLGDVVPPQFDYKFLQSIDVVQIRGRRVAKLTFARFDEPCEAIVLILPQKEFRTTNVVQNPTAIKIETDATHPVTYLILFNGPLERLHSVTIHAAISVHSFFPVGRL